MDAIRFGDPGRQLFGLYLPADGPLDRRHSVLLCNPFGQEAIRSHRLFRVLGERLARDGFHVLRFDYFGTGDSDGDSDGNESQGGIAEWIGDIARASAQLIVLSGQPTVSWFGLRLGATLAAMASARADVRPNRLVLWDPVTNGTEYLHELAAAHQLNIQFLHASPRPTAAQRDQHSTNFEALGFALPPNLQTQISSLSTASFAAIQAASVLTLASANNGDLTALEQKLNDSKVPFSSTTIASRIVWASSEAMNSAIVPADALQAIVAAMTSLT